MLHIIGLILKWIGILLLVILGILVLLVCAVLFSSLRYRFKASCDGQIDSLQADLSLFWFFRLVRAEVHVRGTTVSYAVKIAWKKFITSETDNQAKDPGGKDGEEHDTGPFTEEEEEILISLTEDKRELPDISAADGAVNEKEETPKQPLKPAGGAGDMEKSNDAENNKNAEKAENAGERQTGSQKRGFFRNITEKIRAWYEKIKYTFQKICDNIKLLLQKKETLMDFIEAPLHRAAFARVLEEMIRFLKRFKPDKLSAELVFGFEDPYLTGKALAFFGMMYPFWGQSVSVIPDFEHRILKGNVSAKGHFRASYAVAAGIRLLLHKPTRTTIGHIRNFKW